MVAWLSKAEWDQVLEYLYSKDVTLQRFALQRISAWKSRYAHSTPVAVECTADLVRCQVLDRSGQLDGDELVLLYGSALVRFVNLITERQQGKVARPLRRLAGNMNIPEWVVNLRHDFTHRKLPTLKWCRKGCKVVLEWLQQEFWSRQLGGGAADDDWDSQPDGEEEEDEEEESELRQREDEFIARQKEKEAYNNVREMLISFEREQYQSKHSSPSQAPLADMSWLLGEIKQLAVDSCALLVDVLLEDGFLIPTVEQLETLGCPASELPSEPKLPQTFLRFWLPLLRMLNSPAFMHLFLERLFVELKRLEREPDDRRDFYLSAWVSEVIFCNTKKFDYHFETKQQRRTRMKDRFFVNRIQLRWQQLLSACMDAPCGYTPYLLQLILNDMEHPLPMETQQRLLHLCSIYTQKLHPGVDPVEQRRQPVYTLETLHERLQYSHCHSKASATAAEPEVSESAQDSKASDSHEEKFYFLRGSPWQVCADKTQWKNYPLGKVPGQSNDPSGLMVENCTTMTVFDQPVEVEGGTAKGVAAPARSTDGVLWNGGDVHKLKAGLLLF